MKPPNRHVWYTGGSLTRRSPCPFAVSWPMQLGEQNVIEKISIVEAFESSFSLNIPEEKLESNFFLLLKNVSLEGRGKQTGATQLFCRQGFKQQCHYNPPML